MSDETFVVELEARAGEVWVLPHGELDGDAADELTQAMSIALASEAAHVIVDLRGLEFLDSAGARALEAPCRHADPGRLALVPGRRAVQRVVDLSGLTDLVALHPADAR